MNRLQDIFDLIHAERLRQDKLWGFPQCNNIAEWGIILAEEFGEAIKEINELHFNNGNYNKVETELIQLAAVCVSIIEHILEKEK